VLRIGARPSRLPALLDQLTAELGADRATAGLATGVGTVALPAAAVERAHQLVHRVGGTSMVRGRPPGAELPAWGPAPSALGVLRAVRAELDPAGRLGAGRFAPWEGAS
jgi:glycolate oxidase FAD binding subunit